MRILNMAYNKLTKTKSISRMAKLHVLELSNNKIINFSHIKTISSIIVLNLSTNKIGNIERMGFKIKNREYQIAILDLSNNHITDISPLFNIIKEKDAAKNSKVDNPSCLSKLELLNVNDNNILNLPDNMQDYTPKLVVANLAYNQLKDKDVKNILNIQTLEVLILRANKRITLDAFYGIDKVLRTIDNVMGLIVILLNLIITLIN